MHRLHSLLGTDSIKSKSKCKHACLRNRFETCWWDTRPRNVAHLDWKCQCYEHLGCTDVAMGDRFWLFIQTLNNDKKSFNSIFDSKTNSNYSFKEFIHSKTKSNC